jgi:hypothetical protein
MAENPETWPEPVRVIAQSIIEHQTTVSDGIIGISLPMAIFGAIRDAGYACTRQRMDPEFVVKIQPAGGGRCAIVTTATDVADALRQALGEFGVASVTVERFSPLAKE